MKGFMKKRFSPQQAKSADRLGYLWLAAGLLCWLFAANGIWDFPVAAWFAPLFLLRFTRSRRPLGSFVGAWLAAVIVTVFWVIESHFYDPNHIISLTNLMILAVMLISHTLLVVPYLLDRLLAPRLSQMSGLLSTLVFPAGLVAFEYINALVAPYGVFFSLGYTQYGNLPLLQVVSITGVYGITFLLAWFGSVSNEIWEHHFSWPRIRTVAVLSSAVLALVLLGGSIRLAFFSPTTQNIRVAGVTASRATYERAMDEASPDSDHPNRSRMHSAFLSITEELLAAS